MEWEKIAIESCSGAEVPLQTLSKAGISIFIVPKKFSVSVKDAIKECRMKAAQAFNIKFDAETDKSKRKEMAIDSVIAGKTDIAETTRMEREIERLMFLGGVLRHGFVDPAGNLEKWDEALLKRLRELPVILDEVMKIIKDYNDENSFGDAEEEEKKSAKSPT